MEKIETNGYQCVGQLWHNRARRVPQSPANILEPIGNTVRGSLLSYEGHS
jgi:hypothetical protein